MDHDETVRRALQDLRSADEARTPDFTSVRARPRALRQIDSRRAVSMAFAAAVVVVTSTTIVRDAMKPPRLVVPAEVIALSSWRPMTDALLYESAALLPKDTKTGVILAPLTRDSSPE
jgi:hypothetical protein